MRMRRIAISGGFTILETMIVLAVTSALFLVAASYISGQQSKTEFSQGVRDLDAKIQQTISEVNNGYYPGRSNATCVVNGVGRMDFGVGTTEQGANQGCLFIGKVIQFAPSYGTNATNTGYNVFTVAGLRLDSLGKPAASLDSTNPQPAFDNSSPHTIDFTEYKKTLNGVPISKLKMLVGASIEDIAAIGIFTNFGKLNSAGSFQSGSQTAGLVAVGRTQGLNLSEADIASSINSLTEANNRAETIATVSGSPVKIVICLGVPNHTNQAMITIGGEGRQLNTVVNVGKWDSTICG